MIKGKAYKTEVYSDISRPPNTINEIWLPEQKIAFNDEGFVFKTDEPRNNSTTHIYIKNTIDIRTKTMPMEDVLIESEYVDKLMKIAEMDEQLKQLKEEYEQKNGIKSKIFPIKFKNPDISKPITTTQKPMFEDHENDLDNNSSNQSNSSSCVIV